MRIRVTRDYYRRRKLHSPTRRGRRYGRVHYSGFHRRHRR